MSEKPYDSDFYDFPYDGHACWSPSRGLRLQCTDGGFAQMSASEARRFLRWLQEKLGPALGPVEEG